MLHPTLDLFNVILGRENGCLYIVYENHHILGCLGTSWPTILGHMLWMIKLFLIVILGEHLYSAAFARFWDTRIMGFLCSKFIPGSVNN